MTIQVTPRAERRFPGEVRTSVISRNGAVLLVQLDSGLVHVLDRDLQTVGEWPLPREMTLEDVSHDGKLTAVRSSRTIAVADSNGRILCSQDVEHQAARLHGHTLWPKVLFGHDGQLLWVATQPDLDRAEVQLRQSHDLKPIAGRSLESHHYRSFYLERHPDPRIAGLVSVEPDYCQISWLVFDGKSITETPPFEIVECCAIHPAGDEMLSCTSGGTARRALPGGQLLGKLPSITPGRPFVGPLAYLSDTRAMISTLEGCLYLLDVDAMRVIDGIEVGKHRMTPIEFADTDEYAGDFSRFDQDDQGNLYSWHDSSVVAWPRTEFGSFRGATAPVGKPPAHPT